MKSISRRLLLVALGASLLPTSWAEDAPAGRRYTPGPFDHIEFSGAAQVRYEQGDRDEVFIEGDDAEQRQVKVELDGTRLVIRQESGWRFWLVRRLRVQVVSRDLKRLVVSGAADVVATAPVQCKELAVSISGAGLVRFDHLTAEHLKFTVSGSGDGQLAGTVQELAISISGRGDVLAQHLRSQRALVSISGMGKAKVWALEELNVRVSGVGGVDYWGNPPKGQRRLTGLGGIVAQGEAPPQSP